MEGLTQQRPRQLETPANLRVHHLHDAIDDDLTLVRSGIFASQPWLHPKFFYDARGSALFDAITETPEYYPTRTEAAIFTRHVDDMLARAESRKVLVEPGSGSCEKALTLLQDHRLTHYAPIEISREYLVDCCVKLARHRPDLAVDAICGDFVRCNVLPDTVPEEGRLIFFPGSTIGNFDPEHARSLLENFHSLAGTSGGYLLIGTDLPKGRKILEAAYNDSQGFTARFNRNILDHLNTRLDCEFVPEDYQHKAFYNDALGRIEMHLLCQKDTQVRIGQEYTCLSAGQSIHTENSYKYRPEAFRELAVTAGFTPVDCWTDDNSWFAVHLLKAA
ncbi:L-histidine N(alpha)-methyltransferase [Marinobacter salicampi]|uniref:L-histidine N(alpha)-methyltransferase n=1 Tax=Marinobacter salicampi TaxID=435907 RepID=UPI00140DAC70|nr:L-histidine N(alpha)-methyltransferase [Marinobacter salicampi]